MKLLTPASVILLVLVISSAVRGQNLEFFSPLKIAQFAVPENVTSADIGAARIQAIQKDVDSAMEAIVLLATLPGQDDYLELMWWRSQHPNLRILIMAIFKCRTTEDRIGVPLFESFGSRFASTEASERNNEIQFVRDNLVDFARALEKLTSNRPRCAELNKQYSSVVQALDAKMRDKK